jgi:hypothetical protein
MSSPILPFLAVSPYTGTVNGQTYRGYVSGACGPSPLPPCPNNVFPYQHDFGSILAFTEYNFNMPKIDNADKGYADYNAPDNQRGNVPLSDFFQLSTARPFVSIQTAIDFSCFQHFGTCTGTTYVPTGPDDDNNSSHGPGKLRKKYHIGSGESQAAD